MRSLSLETIQFNVLSLFIKEQNVILVVWLWVLVLAEIVLEKLVQFIPLLHWTLHPLFLWLYFQLHLLLGWFQLFQFSFNPLVMDLLNIGDERNWLVMNAVLQWIVCEVFLHLFVAKMGLLFFIGFLRFKDWIKILLIRNRL